MIEKRMSTRIPQKHDTEENWIKAVNFTPKNGEFIIYDEDENYSYKRVKIGDGTTNVNTLPFIDENATSLANQAIEAINIEVTERQSEIAVERARINNIINLEEGSTTGDAELIDIRVGADGTTYSTAGESVRTQVSNLRNTLNSIATYSENLLVFNENNFYNFTTNAAAPIVTYYSDGFELVRGGSANYSIVFTFATEANKSYDLSFNFKSGTIAVCAIVNNFNYPNAPSYISTTHIADLSTSQGQQNVTFTATGNETMLYFVVSYNSNVFILDEASCIESDAKTQIKKEVLPDEINNIAINAKEIGKRITFVDNVSDFTELNTAINTTGERVTKNQRPSTDYINIQGCSSIVFGLCRFMQSSTEVYNVISFYDADKNYISGVPSFGNGYLESITGIPANAVYAVGSWGTFLTDKPYIIGVYDNGLTERLNAIKIVDGFNTKPELEIVNSTMTLPEFATAINSQWEAYATLCRCKPWSFMRLKETADATFDDMCELINKNFRTEVANPSFSFAENCRRINNAFTKPIYRFIDAKLNTSNNIDFSLYTNPSVSYNMGEPSVVVSNDGSTMSIYAYMLRTTTTDGVNWSQPVGIKFDKSLIHVNVGYIDGIYYLTGCESAGGGGFYMLTSTDGINFSLAGKIFPEHHVFAESETVECWGNSSIMKDYGSNKYYLYVEYNTGVSRGWRIALVTATDLLVENDDGTVGNWEEVSVNPILSQLWGNLDGSTSIGACNPDFAKGEDNRPVKVDNKYYMYIHSTHPNYANILRVSSENLVDWNIDGVLLDNRDTPIEGDDTSGNADHCIIQFKGRTYLFYSWNANHLQSSTIEYIKYMIDDRPIREILSLRP